MLENPENAKTSGAIKRIKRVIEDSDKIPKSFKETLTALADRTALKADEADNKLLMFQKEIETWFDRSMDRASGVYKRNTQLLCFCLGLAIAVFFNIDSIYIAQRLAHDSTLRTALVAGATTIIQGSQTSETNSQNNPSTQAKTIDQKILLKNINTVLGSADAPIIVPLVDMNNAENLTSLVTVACPATNPKSSDCEKKEVKAEKFLSASLGWIITTFAIYMGAPFWFDILNKLVNVRSTGKKSQ